jgi:hypothetical protein
MRLTGGFQSADEMAQVTGLFEVEGTSLIGGSEQTPELVWEVAIMAGVSIRRVYWISSKTSGVMQLVPKH